jgi:hypothetical protein
LGQDHLGQGQGMSAKSVAAYAASKGIEPGQTAADIRHQIEVKMRKAQKLLTEVMELEAKLEVVERN